MTPRRAAAATAAKGSEETREGRNSDDTRERILNVATEQFAAKGLSGARVDEIAREAQANKQLVYYYFGDKLGLYNEVLGHMVDESMDKLREEAALETLAEKMKHLTATGTHPNSVGWQRLLAWEALEANPNENDIAREDDRKRKYLRHITSVREAQERGEIDPELDPEMLALALVSMALFPFVLPQITKFMTGSRPIDADFEKRYEAFVGDLIARLEPRDS